MGVPQIIEQDHVHDQWYKEAEKVTIDTLSEFLRHLIDDYKHDHNTICHAIAAGSLATAWAMRASCGGIGGLQPEKIMRQFVRNWLDKEGPLQLVEYEKMLYPQYQNHFYVIPSDAWKWLQERARQKLSEHYANSESTAHQKVVWHWQDICDGRVPFGYQVEGNP